MKITQRTEQYNLELIAEENIKILINDIEVFNETIGTDKKAIIQFRFQEENEVV